MMFSRMLFVCFLGAAALVSALALAQQSEGNDVPVSAPAGNKVAAALAAQPLFNNTCPNLSARYYIYLCSARWCGPCNREMPNVVKAYEEMKQSGQVELVFVGVDHEQEDAQAFLSKFGATFPAIMNKQASALPGYQKPRGIPSATIVDAEGNVVQRGHGSIVKDWKNIISAHEMAQKASAGESVMLKLEPQPIILANTEQKKDDAPGANAEKSPKHTVTVLRRNVSVFHGLPARLT